MKNIKKKNMAPIIFYILFFSVFYSRESLWIVFNYLFILLLSIYIKLWSCVLNEPFETKCLDPLIKLSLSFLLCKKRTLIFLT